MEQQIFLWPLRIYYEDTDAGGVVYHSQYLNFLERARSEWLRHLGFSQTQLQQDQDLLFVVYKMALTFQFPARFEDALSVSLRVLAYKASSVIFIQTIDYWPRNLKMQPQALSLTAYGQIFHDPSLLTAEVKISAVSASRFRPCALPQMLLQAMDQQQYNPK